MADAVWPASLPRGPKLGHKETPPRPIIRTQMDVGPAKVRPRSTADVTKFESVTLYFTRSQVATFDAFYQQTLGFGSLSFEFTHPRTGKIVDARMVNPPEYTAMAPRQAAAREIYKVDLSLEFLPGTEQDATPPPPHTTPPPPDAKTISLDAAAAPAPGFDQVWFMTIAEPDTIAPTPDTSEAILFFSPATGDVTNYQMLGMFPDSPSHSPPDVGDPSGTTSTDYDRGVSGSAGS